MVLELALLRVVVVNRIEEILVEIVPLLEGKLLAEYTWSCLLYTSDAADDCWSV